MKILLPFTIILSFLSVGLSLTEASGRHSVDTASLQKRVSEPLIIALKPDKDPEAMLEEKAALEDYLSKQLDIPVSVIIPLSTAVIIEGLTNQSIDLAYLSASGAIKALDRGVADILLAGEIDGNPYYLSYWVALKDRPYQSIEELRGKPIAFASKTSTSGFLIPLQDLYEKGLLAENAQPETFSGEGNVYYGVGYVSAIERVLAGEAEAAAVSYYVLDKNKHLTEAQRTRLKKIASQGPVPTHTLAVRRTLPYEVRTKLQEALLALNEEDPQLRNKVFTSKLIEVDAEAHLKPIRKALKTVALIAL